MTKDPRRSLASYSEGAASLSLQAPGKRIIHGRNAVAIHEKRVSVQDVLISLDARASAIRQPVQRPKSRAENLTPFNSHDHTIATLLGTTFNSAMESLKSIGQQESALMVNSLRSKVASLQESTDLNLVDIADILHNLGKELLAGQVRILDSITETDKCQRTRGAASKILNNTMNSSSSLFEKTEPGRESFVALDSTFMDTSLIKCIAGSKTKEDNLKSLKDRLSLWLKESKDLAKDELIGEAKYFIKQDNSYLAQQSLVNNTMEYLEDINIAAVHDQSIRQLYKTDTGLKKIQFGKNLHRMMKIGGNEILEADVKQSLESKHEIISKKEIALPMGKISGASPSKLQSFIIEPREIVFKEFTPHNTYIGKVIVRNTSKKCARFVAKFPEVTDDSPFFKLSLPDSGKVIAPGLSFLLNVEFEPNSYKDRFQNIRISSVGGDSCLLNVKAYRRRPNLSLLAVLKCGECRPGLTIKKIFPITNRGGSGRFLIHAANSSNSIESFEEIGASNHGSSLAVQIGLFTFNPGYFSFKPNQTAYLTVEYSPKITSINGQCDFETAIMACDNGENISFKVSGSTGNPNIEMIDFARKDSELLTRDPFDYQIAFEDCNPLESNGYIVKFRNKTGLSLPFKCLFSDYNEGSIVRDNTALNMFSCQPSKGVIEPNSVQEFSFNFSPTYDFRFESICEILLNNTDSTMTQKPSIFQGVKNDCLTRLNLTGFGVKPLSSIDISVISLPFGFQCGDSFDTTIVLSNFSASRLAYSWVTKDINLDTNHVFIEKEGYVEWNDSRAVSFKIVAFAPGRINGRLICDTGNGHGPKIVILVKGFVEVRPLSLVLDAKVIDFGILQLGRTCKLSIPLSNSTEFLMGWEIQLSKPDDLFVLKIVPRTGILGPNESVMIDLTLIPTWYQSIKNALAINMKSLTVPGNLKNVILKEPYLMAAYNLLAVVQTPTVRLVNSFNEFTCFLNVPVKLKLEVVNSTKLYAKCKWAAEDQKDYIVKFMFQEIELEAECRAHVDLEITFLSVGSFKNIKIIAEVMDMVEDCGQIVLEINASCRNVSLGFSVLENETAWSQRQEFKSGSKFTETDGNLRLDFGMACPVSESRVRTIRISNRSAIIANYSFEFKKFGTLLKDFPNDSILKQAGIDLV